MPRSDDWLGAVLEREVFAVDHDDAAAALGGHASAHPGALYWTRTASHEVGRVRELAAVGFYPVDTTVTLRRAPRPVPAPPTAPVVGCEPRHEAAVAAIGGSAFATSRFHLDPLVPDALAGRVKREWARNNARGTRGVDCMVALHDDRAAGFLSVLDANGAGRRRVIDLVAVAPEHQGRGLGRALVEAFVRRHGPECDLLEVGTQAANVGSLALYGRLGFEVAATGYVLHMHADGGRT